MISNDTRVATFKFVYEDTILLREKTFLIKAISREEALAKVKEDPVYSTNLRLKDVGVISEI
jgi:hypothetical protein